MTAERARATREAKLDVKDMVENFLLDRRTNGGRRGTGATAQTISTYKRLLLTDGHSWARNCGSFGKGKIDDYLTRTRNRVAEITYVKVVRHLKVFLKWAAQAYGITNPIADMKIRVPDVPPDAPDKPQVDALLAACADEPNDTPDRRFHKRRMRLLISLYAGSALRRDEALGAWIRDFDRVKRRIHVIRKGGEPDEVPVTLGTVKTFDEFKRLRPDAYPEDYLVEPAKGSGLLARKEAAPAFHQDGPSAATMDYDAAYSSALVFLVIHTWTPRGGAPSSLGLPIDTHSAATRMKTSVSHERVMEFGIGRPFLRAAMQSSR